MAIFPNLCVSVKCPFEHGPQRCALASRAPIDGNDLFLPGVDLELPGRLSIETQPSFILRRLERITRFMTELSMVTMQRHWP
jgi:hypothetical protein